MGFEVAIIATSIPPAKGWSKNVSLEEENIVKTGGESYVRMQMFCQGRQQEAVPIVV